MKENLAQGTAGDGSDEAGYLKKSTGKNVFDSLKVMAFGGGLTGKGGKISQNGGEWLFGNGELVWARRMRHTADHAGVGELKEVLGLE